ncbi:hypothetical protein DFH09DRAFT_164786 [Mycena vulgaris]|nr:hypothetical protein DFH09DRAFT_164786 [Mycena vulgaris]
MSTKPGFADHQLGFNQWRLDDTFSLPTPASPGPDFIITQPNSELGCRVSRRLGTVSSGIEAPRQRRSHPAKAPRHSVSRIGKLWRRSAPRAAKYPDSDSESEEGLSFIIDLHGFIESASPGDSDEFNSDSDEDEDFSFLKARHGFTDPRNGDDVNSLDYFGATSALELWSIDMRLTLLWCLAYEARFRRRGPALELWLGIIDGSRERVDWGMWEDGDEIWLRNMVIQRQMAPRFRGTAAKLVSEDWRRALGALRRRVARAKPFNALKTWSPQDRVLRIAWCAVTDGFSAVGKRYLDLVKPIDSWTYFTYPFRPSYDQDMKLRLHDQPGCSLSSCKVGVWQWFRTAIFDYDVDQIQTVIGCCGRCVSRAFPAVARPGISPSLKEPAIWPVILWVAFQVQVRHSPRPFDVDAFIALIDSESKADEQRGLWSWDDTDEQTLRQKLVSPEGSALPWIDRYPASWQEYILLLDPEHWIRLEAVTHQISRPRLQPPDYDAAIRVGAIVLWASSNSIEDSQEINVLLALHRFLPGDTPSSNRGFLRCLLERRSPVRANHHEVTFGSDAVDWNHPRIWLDRNREQLRSAVLHDADIIPFVYVAENVHMVYHVARGLPLRFMSSVFSCLLKKYGDDRRFNDFRIGISTWKTWDVTTSLIHFRSVLSVTLQFSKLLKDEDLPHSLINAAVHTDILCICAQIAAVLRDPLAYEEFLKAQNENAQKLLDLLQDLLDYPFLDAGIRPVILKALLKLSTTSRQHPRCFALSDLHLEGQQVAAGSFSDVWKGLVHSETVSVKVMRVYQEADVEALAKGFYHEALIWRQLSHPNLLPFFGVYYLEDTKCRLGLVSPWMENGNIARYLRDNPAGINRLTLVLDVALGLEHLHSLKLVHGDLKAINVLVTRSGRAVLADFGLSSVADSKILLLSTSTLKTGGTARWHAPELFAGSLNSFASDVYAFACVCYEIFTGNHPFHELVNDVAVMYQVMQGSRPKQQSSIPDEVWNLMVECWKPEPEQRPSADEIVFRLRDRPIDATPTDAASDWDPWYTSKFRSSLEEHTLFRS